MVGALSSEIEWSGLKAVGAVFIHML